MEIAETRKNTENVKASVSKWSGHKEYSHNAKINIFWPENMSCCRGSFIACPALLSSDDSLSNADDDFIIF